MSHILLDFDVLLRPCFNKTLNAHYRKTQKVSHTKIRNHLNEIWNSILERSFFPYVKQIEKKDNTHHYLVLREDIPQDRLEALKEKLPFLKPKPDQPLCYFISPFNLDTVKAVLIGIPSKKFRNLSAESKQISDIPLMVKFYELKYKNLKFFTDNSTYTVPQMKKLLDSHIPDIYDKTQFYAYLDEFRQFNSIKRFVDHFSFHLKDSSDMKIYQHTCAPKKNQNKSMLQPKLIDSLAERAKDKIARFLKKAATKKKRHLQEKVEFIIRPFDVFLEYPFRRPNQYMNQLRNLITRFEKNRLRRGFDSFSIHKTCYDERFKISDKTFPSDYKDPKALFNRNLTVENFGDLREWSEAQESYILSLPTEQKFMLFTYTYGGDKMLNNFLLGKVEREQVIPEFTPVRRGSPYLRYISTNVYPLAWFVYADAMQSRTIEEFCGSTPLPFREFLEILWPKIHGHTFADAYPIVFKFFLDHRTDFPQRLLESYIRRLKEGMEEIIRKAPKTPIQFWLYRGITKRDYVVVGRSKKYVFQNNLFMSTSFNICRAGYFKNLETDCCIQQILVPKGVSCVFMELISAFPGENEVLFAPKSYLYPMTGDFEASNVKVQTRKFLIAN